jgi:hypothetical protein
MESKNFEIKGLSDIEDALKTLPAKLQAKIFKAFLAKAGREFVVKPLKSELNYSQKTESNIKVVSDSRTPLRVSAGVTNKAYPLRWTDLGTKVRTGKKGQNKGRIIGKHQIQPILEAAPEKIVKFAQEELSNEIQKIMERQLKKIKKKL